MAHTAEGESKALAAGAALTAAAGAYTLEYWREWKEGDPCPFLCAGTGYIALILPCPLHNPDGLGLG